MALVLSGGGARGAYEVGVLAGMEELFAGRDGAPVRPLFDVVTGASVGAMNAVHVAAFADRPEQGIRTLVQRWTSLDLETHVRPRLGPLLGWSADGEHSPDGSRWGRALLDPRPFEDLFHERFPWDELHANVQGGLVQALMVSALNIATGRTVSFVELAPRASFAPSRDPRRDFRVEPITPAHVLASAAIPLVFPARRIGRSFFCDGALRFNTPMSPAIRAGADRLVVVALRSRRRAAETEEALRSYPNPIFLLGKIFDALLLDPIEYDLQVLERFNRMLEVLSEAATPEAMDRVGRVLEADRGVPYRRLRTLVFHPSQDIGVLALEHFRSRKARLCASTATTLLLENAAALGAHVEADFLSYVLFDGAFARMLIDLGRRDVMDRASEIRSFFSGADDARAAASSKARALAARA